jgi:hypothetical protein
VRSLLLARQLFVSLRARLLDFIAHGRVIEFGLTHNHALLHGGEQVLFSLVLGLLVEQPLLLRVDLLLTHEFLLLKGCFQISLVLKSVMLL